MFYSKFETPLGIMWGTTQGEDTGLSGLYFDAQKYFPKEYENWILRPELPVFQAIGNYLISYFKGENPELTMNFEPKGTPFQQKVWTILQAIPVGTVTTYGKIAKEMTPNNPKSNMSAQAVGQAVGHNPLSILIPCHRVVGSDGQLTGYAGGVDRKIALLKLEGITYE